ncbi:MAG: FAD/NAD(P)-binding protein, partial [Cyanobacteria bacterium J06600_6]
MQGLKNVDQSVSNLPTSDTSNQFLDNSYDLVIIGSGISCAYTLIHYLSLLSEKLASVENKSAIKTVRVAVFDKSGEFWKGIPYGSRSGKQALIITPLKEFLPHPERELFINWLQENNSIIFESLEKRSGDLNLKWLESYRQAIEQGCWEELFVPRYLFGWYLQERVTKILESVEAQNYVRFESISADVCDVQKLDRGYQIETADQNTFLATKVVLAIGSPPNKSAFARQLEVLEQSSNREDLCCITNMYKPSQDQSIERVLQHLAKSPEQIKQILIIGSNASALETIYSLNNRPEVAQL